MIKPKQSPCIKCFLVPERCMQMSSCNRYKEWKQVEMKNIDKASKVKAEMLFQ